MPKANIQEIYPEKYELKKRMERDWQTFLNKDTYLIFVEKHWIFKKINQLTKFPRQSLFKFRKRRKIRQFIKKMHELIEEINEYNDNFIKRRLKEYSSFFEGKDDDLK